jgi:prepilin-type N-terminal cleavage/methylation domain-containing protein
MKKGFTLIELLAVIAIIGIVALITAPAIGGILKNSEKGAFEDSVASLVKAVDMDKASSGFNINRTYNIVNGVIEPNIDLKTQINGTGVVKLDEDGRISAIIQYNDWCATKLYDQKRIVVKEEACVFNSDTSLASEPSLSDGLIPIRWDGTKWVKADYRNPVSAKWYDYTNRMWANAALVKEVGTRTREYYQSDAALGVEVREVDILMYLVWIPRFNYAISGVNNIVVNFEEGIYERANGTGVAGSYLTHPAFTYGSRELTGFWFGKFETAGTLTNLRIKPNEISLRNIQPLVLFSNLEAVYSDDNEFGLSKSIFEARMAKNTEWAAVTYLTASQYGNSSQVWKNNSNTYITGCAGSSAVATGVSGCANAYSSTNGVRASTTGNVYGIYDMAGGINEFVMGNYRRTNGGSGFVSFPSEKYYNHYTTSSPLTACFNLPCTGHGLSETAGWYSGTSNFVTFSSPWLVRGGDFSSSFSSIYSYTASTGIDSLNMGFRLTISNK